MKNKLWFKSKKYGWGWYPSTWQGFVITLIFTLAIASVAVMMSRGMNWLTGFISILILAGILVIICYKTGEKPRWRWGD